MIEVNTNPCIEESSPLLEMILPRMLGSSKIYIYINYLFIFLKILISKLLKLIIYFKIKDDAFKLTIDILFPKL